jgi:hypothetical protein
MIIVDKAPISTEIWGWFSERAGTRVKNLAPELPVGRVLLNLLFIREEHLDNDEEEDERARWPRDYRKLTLPQFWDIFADVFMMCTGIFEKGVSPKVTMGEIQREFRNVVDVATWWAVVEGVDEEMFSDFDYKEVDIPRGRVNPTLRYKIYYMCLTIEEAVKNLQKTLETLNMSEIKLIGLFSATSRKDEMEAIIREKSKGDLDEFILYAIQAYQFKTMGPNHNKLAQLLRYLAFNEKDFDKMLPPCEVWRLLFPNYFDGVEDYFNRFYHKFTNECILYFLTDYLAKDYNIQEIPIYRLFTRDGGLTNTPAVDVLVDVDEIQRDIVKVESKYRLS